MNNIVKKCRKIYFLLFKSCLWDNITKLYSDFTNIYLQFVYGVIQF